jgi:hypothetical protein
MRNLTHEYGMAVGVTIADRLGRSRSPSSEPRARQPLL